MTRRPAPIASAALALLLLPGCTPPASPPRGEVPYASVPVVFRDIGATGQILRQTAAAAYVYTDGIRVVVRSGTLDLVRRPRSHPLAYTALLAYGDTRSTWNARRESGRIYVPDIRASGDTLRDSLVFWIPHTQGLDLSTHFLGLREYARINPPTRVDWHDAFREMWGDLDVFRGIGRPSRNR